MKEPIRKLDVPGDPHFLKPIRFVVAALILRQSPPLGSDPQPVNGTASTLRPASEQPAPPASAPPEVLICQRRPDQPMSLKWEFPGGKIEAGESSEQALARELDEELGIHATIGRRVARVRHKYRNGGAIDLQFFLVHEFTGALENRIFNEVRWSPLANLPEYDFLAADLGLIRDLSEGKLL